jgi:hypothetical protein
MDGCHGGVVLLTDDCVLRPRFPTDEDGDIYCDCTCSVHDTMLVINVATTDSTD